MANVTPITRRKIAAVIAELEALNFQPLIVSALRSSKEQAKKLSQGYSKTKNSKHLAGSDGLARATDITDIRWGYNTKTHADQLRAFWLTMMHCATLHGLNCGGLWIGAKLNPLAALKRMKLKKFLASQQPWVPANYSGPLGWDPSHLEQM